MKVDLQAMKTAIERELQQLEQRRSALKERMADIEAVQRMVSGITKVGEPDRLETAQEEASDSAPAGGTGASRLHH